MARCINCNSNFSPPTHNEILKNLVGNQYIAELRKALYLQDSVHQFESKAHFDNCDFDSSLNYINSLLDEADSHIKAAEKAKIERDEINLDKEIREAFFSLGQILHSIQDFYAHSNYIELSVDKAKKASEIRIVELWLPKGKNSIIQLVNSGLVSGYVFWGFPQKCKQGTLSHGDLAKDSATTKSGKKKIKHLQNQTQYEIAVFLASEASFSFMDYAFKQWPILNEINGDSAAFEIILDRRKELTKSRTESIEQKTIPECRLENSLVLEVQETIKLINSAYIETGKSLPYQSIKINPKDLPEKKDTLNVWIIKDSPKQSIDASGCIIPMTKEKKNKEYDNLSVTGGCFVPKNKLEIRCSADSLKIFSDRGKKGNLNPNPGLLYILGHEIGHIIMNKEGTYSDKIIALSISDDKEVRLKKLKENCKLTSHVQEEEADTLSFSVLEKLLIKEPYIESMLSERGSLLWNIDRLTLTVNKWDNEILTREQDAFPRIHNAFKPKEFPKSDNFTTHEEEQVFKEHLEKIEAQANIFVCDSLKKGNFINFPAISRTHPSLEQRVRKFIEKLKPIANKLSSEGGTTQFESIKTFQPKLIDITTFIHRESGVYLELLNNDICSIVGAKQNIDICTKQNIDKWNKIINRKSKNLK